MADHGEKKVGGLKGRSKKLGNPSRKRANAFKSLQGDLSNLSRNAQTFDRALAREIERLEKRLNKGHEHQKRQGKPLPPSAKERGV